MNSEELSRIKSSPLGTSPAARARVNSTQLFGPLNSSKILHLKTFIKTFKQEPHKPKNPRISLPYLGKAGCLRSHSSWYQWYVSLKINRELATMCH